MTNIGIIHPEEGYLEKVQELAKKYGTLLIIDETHTISAGIGGCTKEYKLKPDMLTIGKAIGCGFPTAVYGFSEEVGKRLKGLIDKDGCDVGGIGGTLAGNALSLVALKSTMEHLLTEKNFKHTIRLAEKFNEGVEESIKKRKLPWIVKRLGCRTEYWFAKKAPKNGGEAHETHDNELDYYMHLYSLNRGILMTPFHNMALICPYHSEKDVQHHTKVFDDAVKLILK